MTAPRHGTQPGFLLDATLASKLASVVVHAEEHLESLAKADANAAMHDEAALRATLSDPDIRRWLALLGPLAPVKR